MTRIQQGLLQTLFVVMFLAYSHAAGAGSFKSIEIYGPYTYHTSALICVKMHPLAPKREVHDPRIPFLEQKNGFPGVVLPVQDHYSPPGTWNRPMSGGGL
jgi:hypothetical protein